MTGAALPGGADTVVKIEDTDARQKAESRQVNVFIETPLGENIRRAGESITRGTGVLSKGTLVEPPQVGVLASVGRASVKVTRRPVIAILVTGGELVDLSKPLAPGKIYDSNTYSVAALVKHYGGIPKILGVAQDDEESLRTSFRRGLDADLLLTTGGVSLGDFDVVRDVLKQEGEMVFWSVRIKPGKPLAVGKIKGAGKDILHLGLPGNPVSAMVTFELFVRPALLKMMGRKDLDKPVVQAVIEEPVINEDGRRIYARAILERRNGSNYVHLTGAQGSGILTSMTLANSLAIIPEDTAGVKKGDTVQVMLLDWKEC